MIKTLIKLAIASTFLYSNSTFALGYFSRACNFNELGLLKAPSLILFRYVGMPLSYLDLPFRSEQEQLKYWALESLTTDYGSLRYYLFAENKIYRIRGGVGYYLETGFRSPWAAESLDPRIFTDSRLQIFKFNRKVLFSARAGHPDILQYFEKVSSPEYYRDFFQVVGQHYYYDTVSKITTYLGRSRAYDCNLTEWGLEDR
jgi:hypothetical protein